MSAIESNKNKSPLDEIYEQITGKPYIAEQDIEAGEVYRPGALLDEILAEVSQDNRISPEVISLPAENESAAGIFLWSLFGKVVLERYAVKVLLNYFNAELKEGIKKEIPAYYRDFQRFQNGEKPAANQPYPGQGYVKSMNKKFESEITPGLKVAVSWLRDLFRRDSERVRKQLWGKSAE